MNILLLHADQHRYDCLGACGNGQVRTPNIDRLARDAVRYDNSFCAYPVCTPSRYSLLSGLYVHQHAGWTNHCTLRPEIETFPRILKAAGWRTAAVGKMHFTPTYLDVGFERMLLAEQDGPGRWDDDYHRELKDLGLVDRIDLEDQRSEYRRLAGPAYWETFGARPSDLPEAHHSTTWIGDRAVEAVRQWRPGERNLLMVGFIKPHHPFDPPRAWADMYDPDQVHPPAGWTEQCLDRDLAMSGGYFPHADLTAAALRRVTACYYATISQIDHQVGRIVQVLRGGGLYDDSLIVYTSDHGDYMGFHHLLLKGGYMYDPLVKVPLLIKYPGAARGPAASGALVSNVDVPTTILARAGCPRGARMSGLDLFEQPEGREMVFAEAHRGRQIMVRSGAHKLLLGGGDNADLFFDLRSDPMETENLHDRPAWRAEARRYAEAAAAWRGPGPLPETCLDEDAPVLDAPNVPPADRSHREAIIEYYHRGMQA